jgi:hypothetical protein
LIAGIVGSNPAEGIAVRLVFIVSFGNLKKRVGLGPIWAVAPQKKMYVYLPLVENVSNFEHVSIHASLICRAMNHALTSTLLRIMNEYYMSAQSNTIHFPVFLQGLYRNARDNKTEIM